MFEYLQVLINELNVAYGVEYDWHGRQRVAYAAKEVVISAGAIMSPQILMLSGIGPKDHLEYFGVRSEIQHSIHYNILSSMRSLFRLK
jgi:choline dehydrogenase-like flavoprotein